MVKSYKIRELVGVKGSTFMLDLRFKDGTRDRPIFKTRDLAEAEVARLKEQEERQAAAKTLGVNFVATPGIQKTIKISDAIRLHTKIKEAEISDPENLRAFKYIQKYNYEGLFALGLDHIHEITLEKVQLFRAELKNRKLSNTTVNKRIGSLRTLLDQCVGWKYISENPCDRIKRLPDDTQSREPWTFDEFQRIHKKLDGWCQNIVTFMFELGCRPKEAIQLTDDDVCFVTGVVTLRTGKGGGSKRKMPLTEDQMKFLVEVMRARKKKFPFAKHVFVDEKGGPIYRNRISDHVAAARKLCKIKKPLVPYGTRHSFITSMQELDVAFGKVQALAGHKRADTTRSYTHLADEGLRNVMYLLEEKKKRQG